MNKEDLGRVLSISCVENYFLGYFQRKFDIRLLYVESFVPFQRVMNSFLYGQASYENYPMERLQGTSEKLGLASHQYSEGFCYQKGKLNLIRVNRAFFMEAKLLPWRADHYIALEKAGKGYLYWNNYPLSEGSISENRLSEIYDGACLIFQEAGKLNKLKYEELSALQYIKIANQNDAEVQIEEEKLINLRNALLILKVLRKRMNMWLRLEAELGNFTEDQVFLLQTENLNGEYEGLLTAVQLQIARKRADIKTLNDKLTRLCESERLWSQAIQMRRR